MRHSARAILATAISLGMSIAFTTPAHAASATYDFHAGDHFGGFLESPDVAQADNGDTLEVSASGTLDAASRTASGSGTFTHRAASGGVVDATGTFVVTGLTVFQLYGCGGGAPANVCGGRAILPVRITAHPASGGTRVLDGVLTVTCLVGSPPAGAHEGIKMLVKDVINFNKSVSGETVFIRH